MKLNKNLIVILTALVLIAVVAVIGFAFKKAPANIPANIEILPVSTETAQPTAEPMAAPMAEATAEPTAAPTAEATAEPTAAPTAEATAEPTEAPTAEATAEPRAAPTAEASEAVQTEQPADNATATDLQGQEATATDLNTAEATATDLAADPLGFVIVYTSNRVGALPVTGNEYTYTLQQTDAEGNLYENVIHVLPDGVYVESANCDSQDCVEEGVVTFENKDSRLLMNMIVCLPHQVQLCLYTTEEIINATNEAAQ